jgi:uncharacterized protein (DUF362 family)
LNSIIKQIFLDFDLAKHKKIFIKPNLGGRYPIIEGENTKYDIISKLCDIFNENGCQEIVIGHSSLLNFGDERCDFESLITHSNFYKLSKYRIAKLLNLDNVKRVSLKVKGFEFNLPEILQTHFYINLCNLKTHMETTVSLSLKNQIGLLTDKERKKMHQTDLDTFIAYLGIVANSNLNIIDGRIGMEGNGPHHGHPRLANMIFCGDDMVEIDSLACKLIGIEPISVRHIRIAKEERVGNFIKEERYNVYRKYIIKFRRPTEFYKKYLFLRVWPNKACSGCIFMLSKAHRTIRKNPIKLIKFLVRLIQVKRFDIILGKDAEANLSKYSNNIFAIGNCTKDFVRSNNLDKFLNGCPPEKNSIIRFLLSSRIK